MANSKTLLVYVLALVVCGSSNSFWVTANTLPIVREGREAPRLYSQQLLPQQEQHQQIQGTSGASPPSSEVQYHQPLPQSSPNNAPPPSISLKNGWGFSAGNSNGGPYTTGYGYLSGNTAPQSSPASQSYMTDYDMIESPPPYSRTSNMLNGWANGLNGMFNDTFSWKSAAFGGFLTMLAGYWDFPGNLRTMLRSSEPMIKSAEDKISTPLVEATSSPKNESEFAEETLSSGPIANTTTAVSKNNATESAKIRRRRSVQPDTDLTELSSMMIAAIQSGECMQRSICLMGTQIGASSKGRVAFNLIDKLIPVSFQENQYFVTLKKALRGGEGFCERFRCTFATLR